MTVKETKPPRLVHVSWPCSCGTIVRTKFSEEKCWLPSRRMFVTVKCGSCGRSMKKAVDVGQKAKLTKALEDFKAKREKSKTRRRRTK